MANNRLTISSFSRLDLVDGCRFDSYSNTVVHFYVYVQSLQNRQNQHMKCRCGGRSGEDRRFELMHTSSGCPRSVLQKCCSSEVICLGDKNNARYTISIMNMALQNLQRKTEHRRAAMCVLGQEKVDRIHLLGTDSCHRPILNVEEERTTQVVCQTDELAPAGQEIWPRRGGPITCHRVRRPIQKMLSKSGEPIWVIQPRN